MTESAAVRDFMAWASARAPGEPEFLQAVHEVAATVLPFVEANPKYAKAKILHRLFEPDRAISFRVAWVDDAGEVQVNRAYRIQFSNAIGPYKGGIRFHPTVNQSVLKFLGFEQIFKNALTGLPMGGAKGGADFDPKGKSEAEVMRFCHAMMSELYQHIGANVDVPAGDIGVGGREIGFMFGQFKRLTHSFEGVLTGKGMEYGGSLMRPEATGYGAVYFLDNMLNARGMEIAGRTAVISGSGNVATHAAEKCLDRGAKPVTLSDSGGFLHDPDGFTQEKIDWIKAHKARRGASLRDYVKEWGGKFHEGAQPWGVPCDVALPCATQNELDEDAAKTLIGNGCVAVSEGANMPCTEGAVHAFQNARVMFGPGKAANAGGVAMSGLEMSQNSARLHRSAEDLRLALKQIMADIHGACAKNGRRDDGTIDYVQGANVAGFRKVADAMLAFGVV